LSDFKKKKAANPPKIIAITIKVIAKSPKSKMAVPEPEAGLASAASILLF
jgi:hypothetical protein